MSSPFRILLLEDSPLDAELTLAALSEAGVAHDAVRVDTREAFEQALGRGGGEASGDAAPPRLDLILADHRLPTFDGLTALRIARERRPELPFIFVSGTLGEEVAIESMKHGATDYVLKQRLNRLAPSVRRAVREARERAERRRAERALAESEDRFRLLVDSLQDYAVFMTDPAGRIVSWNGGAARVLGWTEAEAVGQHLALIFTPEDVAAGADRWELDTAAADGRASNERWHLRKGGARFYASGVVTALRGPAPDRALLGFAKVLRDMTERKRADEALRDAYASLRRGEARLRRLMESNVIGVITAYLDGRVTNANDAFLDMVGHARADVEAGRVRWDRMTPPEHRPADERAIDRLRAEGACAPYEKEYARPDGTRVPVLLGIALLPESRDETICFVLDLTERKRAERDRAVLLEREQAARLDAERLRREADRARDEAEAANRSKDEFLATVSHELRTPLTAMLGWARLLRGDDVDAETIREGLETIERNANAQAQLIDDILDISRIITGKLRLNIVPTDLAPVVHEAMDTVRPAADAKGIRLTLRAGGAGLVSADRDRIQQVVWNLMSNAIKFTPRGGEVTVVVDRHASRARVSVTDTGRGIATAFLPYVFDRFRQADASSTRRHGGLGLGLAICRHLVELHGGTIEATSEGDGRGATFAFTLPMLAARPELPASRRATPPGAPAPLDCPPVLQGVRVLVVDDEPDARRLLSALLERCRAEVVTAGSAAEAMSVIERERPDVLVSDIGMPDEDGYSLIRRVRLREQEALGGDGRFAPGAHGDAGDPPAAAAAAPLPAAALTAYTRPDDRTRALEAGFQAHIAKPVEPANLIEAVATLAGRKR